MFAMLRGGYTGVFRAFFDLVHCFAFNRRWTSKWIKSSLARLYPFQTKERITKGPISGMTALFGRSFEVSDRRQCHRRAARVSQVKSLSHNTHGPAEALPPTAMGFGKMDKVELRNRTVFPFESYPNSAVF